MPNVREVFQMSTQKIEPELGFVERQHDHRRRRDRNRKIVQQSLRRQTDRRAPEERDGERPPQRVFSAHGVRRRTG